MVVGLHALGTGKHLAANAHERGGASRYPNETLLDTAQRIFKQYTASAGLAKRSSLDRAGESYRKPLGSGSMDEADIARSLIKQFGISLEVMQKEYPGIVCMAQLEDLVMGRLQSPEYYYDQAREQIKNSPDGYRVFEDIKTKSEELPILDREYGKGLRVTLKDLVKLKAKILGVYLPKGKCLDLDILEQSDYINFIQRVKIDLLLGKSIEDVMPGYKPDVHMLNPIYLNRIESVCAGLPFSPANFVLAVRTVRNLIEQTTDFLGYRMSAEEEERFVEAIIAPVVEDRSDHFSHENELTIGMGEGISGGEGMDMRLAFKRLTAIAKKLYIKPTNPNENPSGSDIADLFNGEKGPEEN